MAEVLAWGAGRTFHSSYGNGNAAERVDGRFSGGSRAEGGEEVA